MQGLQSSLILAVALVFAASSAEAQRPNSEWESPHIGQWETSQLDDRVLNVLRSFYAVDPFPANFLAALMDRESGD